MARSRVRRALPDDAALLAAIERSWWREAYADLLPANVLNMEPGQLGDAWAAQLAGATGLIAEESTHPVGFALVDNRLSDDLVGRIEVLGVLPRWGRRGHGGRLLTAAAELLRSAGAERGAWWAVESDPSVAAFLAGVGWGQTGQRRVLDTGEGRLAEIEYGGDLAIGPSEAD